MDFKATIPEHDELAKGIMIISQPLHLLFIFKNMVKIFIAHLPY